MAIAPILDDTGADDGTGDEGASGAQDTGTAATGAGAGDGAGGSASDAGDGGSAGAANDDWRSKWAGEDKDALKFLGRFHSADAAVKAWKKQSDDIKGGKYITPLPENATDAEKAAYRTQLGVPDKPEAYLEKLSDGLVVGEDDKPFVDQFLTNMHAANAPPALVNAALETYYEIIADQAATEADAIAAAKDSGIEALREEWGADYKRNLNIASTFLGSAPESVSAAILQGKGPDGVPLGSNPEVIKWLTSMALEINPTATVVPGAGANQASAIADEIAALETRMSTDRTAYFKDQKAQDRYVELIEARDKIAARG